MLRSELSKEATRIYNHIKEFAEMHELDIGEVDFYSEEDWRNRGEQYALNSKLVMVFDGGWMYDVLNMTFGYELFEALHSHLQEMGLFAELGHSWNAGIYSDD